MTALVAASLALLAAASGTPATGKIGGRITLTGLPPKLANLPVTKDLKICGTSKPEEALEVGSGGGVKDVVLWLPEGPKPAAREAAHAKLKLDQQACQFVPHVIAAEVGSILDVVNSDPVLHNVHATENDAKAFNYAMPIKGQIVPTRLKTVGLLKLKCDVHPWMRADVQVLPTSAFSVTGEDGSYLIDGVPPGHWKLHLWTERLGERDEEVDVVAGQTTQHDVALTPR
jgi:plastocyanin